VPCGEDCHWPDRRDWPEEPGELLAIIGQARAAWQDRPDMRPERPSVTRLGLVLAELGYIRAELADALASLRSEYAWEPGWSRVQATAEAVDSAEAHATRAIRALLA